MKNYLAIVILSFLFTSCLRLDDNLYNPKTDITAYNLDNYTGETDFTLDVSYQLPDSMIHVFELASQGPEEMTSTVIYAVYIGNINTINSDTVIMYCHGNADHMDFYWPRAKLLANTTSKNNYGVLMIDYRGYGLSKGKPSEEGLYADVDAGLKWLKSKGLTSNKLVIYGFSMGSAPATQLSAGNYSLKPMKLMLEAPFASAEVMVQDGSGLAMPGSFFTDLKIDNAEEIKQITQPLFWIHGQNDNFLNIATHGEVVFANHHGTYKEAHRIAGAEHSTIQETMGFQNYLNAVSAFIEKP